MGIYYKIDEEDKKRALEIGLFIKLQSKSKSYHKYRECNNSNCKSGKKIKEQIDDGTNQKNDKKCLEKQIKSR